MNNPDWKDAPDWAQVLLQQPGFNGPCYCWAASNDDGAKSQWHEDLGRDHMIFELRSTNWNLVEVRPC